jgi:hypothetical protein
MRVVVRAGGAGVSVEGELSMVNLKKLMIATVLIAGATSLAIAQGPPTGGYPPVGGGAEASPIGTSGTGGTKATSHKKSAKHQKKSSAKPQ